MKITKSQLKRIIKEEISRLLESDKDKIQRIGTQARKAIESGALTVDDIRDQLEQLKSGEPPLPGESGYAKMRASEAVLQKGSEPEEAPGEGEDPTQALDKDDEEHSTDSHGIREPQVQQVLERMDDQNLWAYLDKKEEQFEFLKAVWERLWPQIKGAGDGVYGKYDHYFRKMILHPEPESPEEEQS